MRLTRPTIPSIDLSGLRSRFGLFDLGRFKLFRFELESVKVPACRLGLLGKFALASVVPVVILGVVLAQFLTSDIERRTLREARRSAVLTARVGFQSQLTPRELKRGLSEQRIRMLDQALEVKGLGDGVKRIKIWNRAVHVVYSDKRSLIGRRYQIFGPLREALQGRVTLEISSLERADNASERRFGKLLEVYVPLVPRPGAPPAGVADVYLPYAPLAAEIQRGKRTIYLLLIAGIGLLYAGLLPIVAGASKRLRRQSKVLEEQATKLRRQAAENEHQALHDPLTGLPNRVLFADRIRQSLRAAERRGGEAAVFLMDLDRFKEVNDTLGHHCGDLLLQELGTRLQGALRTSDTVARLGGDEFGVLLPEVTDRHSIEEVVERMRGAVEKPFNLQGLPLALETSIGIALFPQHGADVDALLQRADVAMYLAKEGNTTHEIYDAEHDDYDPTRLTLIGELRRALDNREIEVYYQPKAELRDGVVKSCEALVRWRHPERGLLPPDEFIPLAQHTGLIRPLTLYVLDTAMSQARSWRNEGLYLSIAVNLAMRNLLDASLPSEVQACLDKWNLEGDALEIEITESTIMADPFRTMAVLEKLSEMGVRLSIDDFGTGYSSLAYLKRLPVDAVKIDKSFVLNMVDDANDAAIVRSTIELARNLGLDVVAEGVENEDIWRRLVSLGCDVAQGYYLSRPVPAEELTAWLADQEEAEDEAVESAGGYVTREQAWSAAAAANAAVSRS